MYIECICSHKSYLPELSAYQHYFQSKGHQLVIYDQHIDSRADVVWRFMGIDRAQLTMPVIHEYSSLSLAPCARLKDTIKRLYNIRPAGRIFLNSFVMDSMGFADGVPTFCRDMGISKKFFTVQKKKKEFDYVYVGAITRSRMIDRLCWHFCNTMKESSLLLIGEPEKGIMWDYAQTANITFAGKQPYSQVPELAMKAAKGINVTPDIYPYSYQTSTKILEYCALGLDVVTTRGHWVESFVQQREGKFFFLDDDFGNLTKEPIDAFSFTTPEVVDLEWERLLNSLQLDQWLEQLLV